MRGKKLQCLVLTFFEMLKTINPKLKDYWNFLPVGSFVKKPVSKKKKNSEAHYQQIWEILESRIDGQGERFTYGKHCRSYFTMVLRQNSVL